MGSSRLEVRTRESSSRRIGFGRLLFSFSLLGLLAFGLPLASAEAQLPSAKRPQPGQSIRATADEDEDRVPSVELGSEYTEYKKTRAGPTKKQTGSGEEEGITFRSTLLYLPNRIVDLFDIFRFDVGVGPSLGGVVRISKYAQVGLRTVNPGSLRVGVQGRHSPVFIESSNEFGISPFFVASKERHIATGEVGFGIDLFLFGVYAGIDVGSVGDFFGGIFGFDWAEDDFH